MDSAGMQLTKTARNGTTMYCFLEFRAEQYMTRSIVSVLPTATMLELETMFETYDFNAFPVMQNAAFMGIVTKLDFLRTFAFTARSIVPPYEHLMRRTVVSVMTTKVKHVAADTPLTRVLADMVRLGMRSFPVLSHQRDLLGMISRSDVIRALKVSTCSQ
jgi:CBS domain-containing membrane protein